MALAVIAVDILDGEERFHGQPTGFTLTAFPAKAGIH
jgi:hypothetical protein